ncbi:MAG: FtsW/RodA/SpoVE family cell cycle protein [Nibricoccus sp.]
MAINVRNPLDWLNVFKTTRERFDWITPLVMAALCTIGVFFIYSAQLERHGGAWKSQIIFLFLGAGVYTAVSLVDYRFWLTIVHWIYLGSLVTLLLVFIPGISGGAAEKWGAKRWIDLGFTSFQPSETAKIAVMMMTASVLTRARVGTITQSLGTLGKLALAAGIPIFLIMLQPDLKSAIVIPPMVFSMLYVSKLSLRFFAVAFGAFVLVVGVVAFDGVSYVRFMDSHGYDFLRDKGKYEATSFIPLHDYQRNRILTFVVPEIIDPKFVKDAYNLNQSLISVGSGGLTGKGWTKGMQAQLGYLPPAVSHNDFIFPVIAEEIGFLGSLTLIGLFGVLLFNSIRIASLARDRLGVLIAIGVTLLFAVHIFVNIAMCIGFMPITGIPLPFISYGGTFLLSCCLLQGLVQSVYRFRKDRS